MECPICLANTATEKFHNDDRHMACKRCYDQVIKTNKCPICRIDLKKYTVYWIDLLSFRGKEKADMVAKELPKFFSTNEERVDYIHNL